MSAATLPGHPRGHRGDRGPERSPRLQGRQPDRPGAVDQGRAHAG